MKKTLFTFLFIIPIITCILNSSANAEVFGGKWESNPTYYMSSSDSYYSYFKYGVDEWNDELAGKDITIVATTLTSAVIFPDADYFGQFGWNALGQPGPDPYSGKYTYATLKFNKTYMNSYTTNKKKAISAHELGHVLGLAHTNDKALMYVGGSEYYYDEWGIMAPTSYYIEDLNTLY